MTQSLHRLYATITLISILIYGIFKILVLRVYADILKWLVIKLNLPFGNILSFFAKQGNHEDMANYSIGWLIYYPTYLLLHIVFIQLLFYRNKSLKFILSLGLTTLVVSIVGFWFGALKAGYPELATFFRTMFYNLFGLPFILLAIEGGRILYHDLSNNIDNFSMKD